MKEYELLYIIDVKLNDEQKNEVINKFNEMIEKDGGKITSVDKWGIKKFAYPIQFASEGFYVFVAFSGSIETPKKVGELMNITDSVIRYMFEQKKVVKKVAKPSKAKKSSKPKVEKTDKPDSKTDK